MARLVGMLVARRRAGARHLYAQPVPNRHAQVVPSGFSPVSQAEPSVATHPWEILVPTVVLTIFVLAFSFLGDGLRDAFDPRSKD